MNDAATIRIFIKGLKNAHSLAARIYEKDPQTLTDAITEVEKLNAAQQLTATIIPSSTVNMMSNEEDQCFNAKNQDTSHDTALTSDVMNVMNMAISSWTALTEYPLQEHQHHTTRHTETATPDQALDTTGKTEKEETRSRSQSRYSRHSSSHCDLHRGCSRSQQWDRHSCHRSSSR